MSTKIANLLHKFSSALAVLVAISGQVPALAPYQSWLITLAGFLGGVGHVGSATVPAK